MIRFALLLVVTSLSVKSFAIDSLSKCRDLYFSEATHKELLKAIEELEGTPNLSPILIAYHGSLTARAAGHSFNPYTKWTNFNKGRSLIETAVSHEPGNPEIRFIRLSVQHAAPSFLGYTEHVGDDLDFVLSALTRGWLTDQLKLRKQIIAFLEKNQLISAPQSNELRLVQQHQ